MKGAFYCIIWHKITFSSSQMSEWVYVQISISITVCGWEKENRLVDVVNERTHLKWDFISLFIRLSTVERFDIKSAFLTVPWWKFDTRRPPSTFTEFYWLLLQSSWRLSVFPKGSQAGWAGKKELFLKYQAHWFSFPNPDFPTWIFKYGYCSTGASTKAVNKIVYVFFFITEMP